MSARPVRSSPEVQRPGRVSAYREETSQDSYSAALINVLIQCRGGMPLALPAVRAGKGEAEGGGEVSLALLEDQLSLLLRPVCVALPDGPSLRVDGVVQHVEYAAASHVQTARRMSEMGEAKMYTTQRAGMSTVVLSASESRGNDGAAACKCRVQTEWWWWRWW